MGSFWENTGEFLNRNLLKREGLTNIALDVTSGGLWELGKMGVKSMHTQGGNSDLPMTMEQYQTNRLSQIQIPTPNESYNHADEIIENPNTPELYPILTDEIDYNAIYGIPPKVRKAIESGKSKILDNIDYNAIYDIPPKVRKAIESGESKFLDETNDTDIKEDNKLTIESFLQSLLDQNQQSITPSFPMDDTQDTGELNNIQMIAMKVKLLNPKIAQELWNMANLPIEQIMELFNFRYEYMSMMQSQIPTNNKGRRNNNYGMGIQKKSFYSKQRPKKR